MKNRNPLLKVLRKTFRMSEEDECNCESNYKDETEHFQIHLVQELMDINKKLGQANILQIESQYLMKEHTNQMTIVGSLISLSVCIISWTLLSIHKRN